MLDRYRQTGDTELRNAVVEDHMNIADFTVRRLSRGNQILKEDLRQVAHMAIVQAAERYRPGKGAAFRTFAERTVEGELKRHLRDKTWTVRPPRRRQEQYLNVCRAEEELTQELGRSPSSRETAARTGLLVDDVRSAVEAGGARTPQGLESTRGGSSSVSPRPETMTTDSRYANVESDADLSAAYEVLDHRERRILQLRFVDELTQPEIAEELQISQSYVSRIIRAALAKLRAELDDGRYVGSGVGQGIQSA
jgi:RNA polymerase sigma-B factor